MRSRRSCYLYGIDADRPTRQTPGFRFKDAQNPFQPRVISPLAACDHRTPSGAKAADEAL